MVCLQSFLCKRFHDSFSSDFYLYAMQKTIKYFLVSVLGLSLLLSACGEAKEFGVHSSGEGFVPEAFMPSDVGVMYSYSLQNDEQFAAVATMEAGLGDEGRVSRTVSESLDTQFEGLDLDYDDDLLPAFGEQFRLVFGSRPGGDEYEVFSVVTLADADAMTAVLDKLVEAEELEFKNLSSLDAYVDEDGGFYATVYEDLLFLTNEPENLVGMTEQDEDTSLWAADEYQEALEEIGSDYVLYAMIFPGVFGEDIELPAGLGIGSLPAVTERQALVVRADEKGLAFDVLVKADKDAAEEAGLSFDSIPRAEPYLFEEIPSDGLMGYLESYGLQQTFEYKNAVAGESATYESLSDFFRAYFAMDFEEEILSFLDKGYAIALHQNGLGVMPGVTIYADVSSDEEAAGDFLDQLDQQVSGLTMVLDAALPGAVNKTLVEIMDEEFDALRIDLTELDREGDSPLPALVTSSEISLAYGILDDRLLVTTALVWEEDGESIGDSSLYNALKDQVEDIDEGLVLVDTQNLASFFASLRALREQLSLGVDEGSVDFEEFLEGFMGGIAAGNTNSYEGRFGGFLMISN